MSPSDCGTMAKFAKNDAETLLRLLECAPILNDSRDQFLVGIHDDFLPVYPAEELLEKTRDYNEVILRGSAEPIAVFVLKTADASTLKLAACAAYVRDIPVVIFNEDDCIITTIDSDTALETLCSHSGSVCEQNK